MDIKRHVDKEFLKRIFYRLVYAIMRHLNIPRFSGHNKVLPSPTSTTYSNRSALESDESDLDSSSSMISMCQLSSPSNITQLRSIPDALIEATLPSYHSGFQFSSNNGYDSSTYTRRASVFHERFDLLELYPRDPLRRTIYQHESHSEPAMRSTYGYGPRRMSRENSVQRIAHMFRNMMGVSRHRKL
ncbi:hypothetical protein K450DRAFT_290402 [Umbelopsis ramanniana AG]|uniref:Uncharacterized protein n=1 Tax=Umbelopsis ramanniana AG TaxID=1314678 RepID=A0AAD5EJF3_UMBRA|nr:uncharacterized protein K450DRAFT_290402 [Umbelopsis ramanniana AG]KAI8583450.1 hypothetical protein K450DRAFT_290402 [Umbelopsis ramanniana AG]